VAQKVRFLLGIPDEAGRPERLRLPLQNSIENLPIRKREFVMHASVAVQLERLDGEPTEGRRKAGQGSP
jgi:hypothetical protein